MNPRVSITSLEPLLKIEQVAEILNVSTKTAYRWSELGMFTRVRLGGLIRFRRHDIELFIEKNLENPTDSN